MEPGPPHSPETAAPARRVGAALGAFTLLLLFARLAAFLRFGSRSGYGLADVAAHEASFWLSHALLIVPAFVLLAVATGPWGDRALRSLAARVRGTDRRTRWAALLALTALLFALYATLRSVVLLDLPLTDDEQMLDFGARILASGHLCVPAPQPTDAWALLYLHTQAGCVASLDFPGNLVFRAAGIISGLGDTLYTLAAAGTGALFVLAAHRRGGARAAVLGAAFWVASPMALWLSTTSHPHIVSRLLIAAAYVVYLGLARSPVVTWRLRHGALLGVLAGLAGVCRPAEGVALLLPIAVHLGWLAVRGRRVGFVLGAALGVGLPLLLLGLYNQVLTDHWYLLPRSAPGASVARGITRRGPWERLGRNTGINVLMLAVWVLGPIGLPLALLGLRQRSATGPVIFAGVLLLAVSGMLHDNTGLHSVGPIHFSEAVLPLLLLAVQGAQEAGGLLARLGATARGRGAWLLATYLAGALLVFQLVHGAALRRQADNQAGPLQVVEEAGLSHAIVVAPQAAAYWYRHPERSLSGSWVLEFPPPDPWLQAPVLFARDDADLARLRRHFPDRSFWRLRIPAPGGSATLRPLRSPRPSPSSDQQQ